MSELNNAVKLVLTKQKREAYAQRYFDLQLELEIANEVDDERARTSATQEMVKLKKVLKFLDKKIEKMEKEVEDFVLE